MIRENLTAAAEGIVLGASVAAILFVLALVSGTI
jgi:hypothetical protein